MDSSQHIRDIFYSGVLYKAMSCMGCGYLRSNFRYTEFQTMLIFGMMLWALVGIVYTMSTQDRELMLQCACLAPLSLQGVSR